MNRYWILLAALGAVFSAAVYAYANAPEYPQVVSGKPLAFPQDHGAHNGYRTEWWYFTGWLETENGDPLGFQITFFRTRPEAEAPSSNAPGTSTPLRNPSKFAPEQIIFAHAAISDPKTGKIVHDQRIGRAGFDIIQAASGDTSIRLLDWDLSRNADGVFASKVKGKDFTLNLQMKPSQPIMLNGDKGYSRKGPKPSQASYYYSMPQLDVSGAVVIGGKSLAVTGRAWLDREWSSDVLPDDAVGWDWTGINFDDGSALMAFQVRGADGQPVYAGGSFRATNGTQTALSPDDVTFRPVRTWTSPETGAKYPVEAEFVVRIAGQETRYRLKPMFDAQELNGPLMPVYWEGAVTTQGGKGYLEMTGYAQKIAL